MYVVDADAGSARQIEDLLRSNGYQPEVFESAIDFLRAHDPMRPGCLILEQALPGVSGLQIQTILRNARCARPVIFVARSASIRTAAEAMRAGAIDFLCKPVSEAELLRAVGEAMQVDANLRASLQQQESICRRFAVLTPREREVFEKVVNGRLNKQIAAELGAGEKTVKVHRARIMEKMRARSLPDLIHFANALSADRSGRASRAPSIATWCWDVRRDLVTADVRLARLFGVPDGERKPCRLARYLSAIDPDDVPRVSRFIRRAVESGGDYTVFYRIALSEQEPRVVMAHGRMEYDSRGSPVRLCGVVMDITDAPEREMRRRDDTYQFNEPIIAA